MLEVWVCPAWWRGEGGGFQVRITKTDKSIGLDSVLGFPLPRQTQSLPTGIREVKQLAKVTQLAQDGTGFGSLADSDAGFFFPPPVTVLAAHLGLWVKLRKLNT